MNTVIKYILVFVFLSSAFSKIVDFESTLEFIMSVINIEYTVARLGLFALIMIEVLFGLLIMLDFTPENMVYYTILIVMVLFTLTSMLFLLQGFENCGCFGTSIIISPLESIIKNIIIIMLFINMRNHVIENRVQKVI